MFRVRVWVYSLGFCTSGSGSGSWNYCVWLSRRGQGLKVEKLWDLVLWRLGLKALMDRGLRFKAHEIAVCVIRVWGLGFLRFLA